MYLYLAKKEKQILERLGKLDALIVRPDSDRSRPYIYPDDTGILPLTLKKMIEKGLVKNHTEALDNIKGEVYHITKLGLDILSKFNEDTSI